MSNLISSPSKVLYKDPSVITPSDEGMISGIGIADSEVVALWERYRSRMAPIPRIEVITGMTTRFATLVGDLETWLRANFIENREIAESTRLFIVDCIQFANGGNRDYGLSTWYDLVNVKNDGEKAEDGSHLLDNTHIPKTEDLLSGWLSRDGGVDDFFVSMNILFGNL